jgi:NAD(P)H dehydrogenase (quinone)
MTSIVIAYHSGYGHTKRVADFVQTGAASVADSKVTMIDVSKIDDAGWVALNAADAIVFGSPTYMVEQNCGWLYLLFIHEWR